MSYVPNSQQKILHISLFHPHKTNALAYTVSTVSVNVLILEVRLVD